MKDNLLTIFDEVRKEDEEALEEWFEEEIQPLIDYLKVQRKKQLEKEYEEVLRLEREAK